MGPFPAGKGRLVRVGGWGGALKEKMTCLNVIRMHGGSEIIHRHVQVVVRSKLTAGVMSAQ